MPRLSAGILPYRRREGELEVFLVHPGGPFWARKDNAAWSISKGEFTSEEDPLAAARREFAEETGLPLDGAFLPLGDVRQSGGKTVHAWAIEAPGLAPERVSSNTFELEWPPRSGKTAEFPEIDRAEWFSLATAREKLVKGQVALLERLERALA
jgi:predicted NUDIX family NTP pyrophosphohydrolase